MEFIVVLLPVVGAIHSCRTVGPIQPDTLSAVITPSSDVQLTSAFIRQDDARGTEDVSLHMHRTPCKLEIVDESQVELVCASGVRVFARAPLFDHRDFVVHAQCSHQGHDNATNQELCSLPSLVDGTDEIRKVCTS